jgi:tetratricopeptide (TPR) repeat protein
LGEKHPQYAASLNNIAGLLYTQGKYDEAEHLYQQSLAIIRKVCAIHLAASSRDHSCQVFGEEHPDVASALHNLAGLLYTQGKYDEAEPLCQQSLAIRRRVCAIHLVASSRDHSCKVLGEEHPDVAASLNNLAELLNAQGKYDDAEPLYRQSLAIDRKVSALMSGCLFHRTSCQVYGDEHPEVATNLNNLAALLAAQGKYDEAEPLYQQSLAIDRKVSALMSDCLFHRTSCQVYGDEHPDVATDLNNLAALLEAQGKYDDAEPLYWQSLAIMRKVCAIHLAASSRDHSCKVLGEEHPHVAASLDNLAMLLWNTGRSEEAYLYGRQALAIATRALGPSHPTTQQYRMDWA